MDPEYVDPKPLLGRIKGMYVVGSEFVLSVVERSTDIL